MEHKSLHRQQRADRKITGGPASRGMRDRKCIQQEIYQAGFWPTGEIKQRVRYLHVTKGWRDRALPPIYSRMATVTA